jgi:CelD/BcsL family acetyltransferase involved in cellulose biosynthesis
MMDVEYVGSPDRVPIAEWRTLAERAGHVFATPEWLLTWWRHYGRGDRALIGLVRREGRLVAIVPLYVWWRRGVPVLRFVGHGPSDQLGPICGPLSEPDAAEAVRCAVTGVPFRRFILLAEQLGGGQGFGRLVGARELYRESSPVLHLESESWEEFLSSRGRNFRQQARRFPRRLADAGEVSYRIASEPARLSQDLDILFELHRRRWGAADTPFLRAAGFHRDFAEQALSLGWLRLVILEIDGAPAAALYGFRFAGTESAYQTGRDPAFQHHPVGFVLLARSVREALVDGMREYRLLRGGSAYKARFATSDPGLETTGLARGGSARLLLAAAAATRGRSLGLRRRILDRSSEPR